MVIVEIKRIPNKNRQFTELQNIWNENCSLWMSYNILRVFIWNTQILLNSIQVELRKRTLNFLSQIQGTKFRSTKHSGHHKTPRGVKEIGNLETVTETCLFLSVYHSQKGSCLFPPITVTEIWQKYSEAHIFSTCFVGNTGWDAWLQNFSQCVLVCQWALTGKTHPDVKIWLVEMLRKSGFTHRTGLQSTLKAKDHQHKVSAARLKTPITTKPKNTPEHCLGTTTLLLFMNTHTRNHTEPQTNGEDNNPPSQISSAIPV